MCDTQDLYAVRISLLGLAIPETLAIRKCKRLLRHIVHQN